MKIGVDDWHFKFSESETLLLDVYLDNGQHALLEVNPMKNPHVCNGEVPEMIVFCELPGEKVAEQNCLEQRADAARPDAADQGSDGFVAAALSALADFCTNNREDAPPACPIMCTAWRRASRLA